MMKNIISALLFALSKKNDVKESEWSIVHVLIPDTTDTSYKATGAFNRICFATVENSDWDPSYTITKCKTKYLDTVSKPYDYTYAWPCCWGFAEKLDSQEVYAQDKTIELEENVSDDPDFDSTDPDNLGKPLMFAFGSVADAFGAAGSDASVGGKFPYIFHLFNGLTTYQFWARKLKHLTSDGSKAEFDDLISVTMPDGSTKKVRQILTIGIHKPAHELHGITLRQATNVLTDKMYFIQDLTASGPKDLYNNFKSRTMKTDFSKDYLMGTQAYDTNTNNSSQRKKMPSFKV